MSKSAVKMLLNLTCFIPALPVETVYCITVRMVTVLGAETYKRKYDKLSVVHRLLSKKQRVKLQLETII